MCWCETSFIQNDTTDQIKTRTWWRLNRLLAESFPWSQHAAKFSGHKSCESGDINCSNCHEI